MSMHTPFSLPSLNRFTCAMLFSTSALALALSGCAAQKSEAPAADASSANEEITNNQESGVDEGGIVKNIGDHLVVLRQGRLFAVNVADRGQARQTGSIRVARDEALNDNVWYDEMLVRGRDIYVIGFRYATIIEDGSRGPNLGNTSGYGVGATEISHFTLGEAGELARAETLYRSAEPDQAIEPLTDVIEALLAPATSGEIDGEAQALLVRSLTYRADALLFAGERAEADVVAGQGQAANVEHVLGVVCAAGDRIEPDTVANIQRDGARGQHDKRPGEAERVTVAQQEIGVAVDEERCEHCRQGAHPRI